MTLSRCGSRQLKFVNLTSNLSVKSQGEVSRDDFCGFLLRKLAVASVTKQKSWKSARNALLAVVNAVKLNFATRRRDGFKFKGGSYLVGSDRVKFKSNDV